MGRGFYENTFTHSFLLSFNLYADDSFKIWGGVFSKTTVNDDFSFWIEDQLRLNGDALGQTNSFSG